MSEEKFSYEQTRHLFNPDQDGATCQHVWRLTENHINKHQITRTCVICHATSGFPDDAGFLRSRYETAENANLGHYLQLAEAEALLKEAAESLWMEGDHYTADKIRAFLTKDSG